MAAPEFITEGKTFPLLYSLYENLITERMQFESVTEAQAHSYSYGRRFDLEGRPGTQYWTITPPDDYFYHLEGLRIFYPEDTVTANTLRIMIQYPQLGRNITHAPLPVPIFTSPGEIRPKHYMVRINTLFGPKMNLVIMITGQDGTNPAYVDMMTEGLYIPAAGLRPV